MSGAVPDILARIVETKKTEPRQLAGDLETAAGQSLQGRRDFHAAIRRRPAVIAEIKKASPSKGVLVEEFDPAAIASAYERGGAAALSVLTDRTYFHGTLEDLRAARNAVSIPVLRKDFTISRDDVLEAAAAGADAILLIAAILTEREMRDFRECAEQFRMSALVEVHDADELAAALASGARIVGVNSRDLRNFQVSLDTAVDLAKRIPAGVTKVAESGISSAADVRRLRGAGYDAFLVGEHLMKSGDPADALAGLLA